MTDTLKREKGVASAPARAAPAVPQHRPRRDAPRWAHLLLRLLFRYSYSRDAWILRVVGGRLGPVFRDL